jgi:hypothetical protein
LDSFNYFNFVLILLKVTSHLEYACVFGTAHFLTMIKPLGKICPIIVGETLYQLTSCALCIQFHNTFVTHLSPHQFKVATKGGCEVVV